VCRQRNIGNHRQNAEDDADDDPDATVKQRLHRMKTQQPARLFNQKENQTDDDAEDRSRSLSGNKSSTPGWRPCRCWPGPPGALESGGVVVVCMALTLNFFPRKL
jgi:hypothetical protein